MLFLVSYLLHTAFAWAPSSITNNKLRQNRRLIIVAHSSEKGFSPAVKKTKKSSANSPQNDTPKSPLLAQLLEEESAKKEALAAEIAELKEREAYVSENTDAGRIPDAVANRMAIRMAILGGVPVFGGLALFIFFYLSATKNDNVFQPTAVAAATTAPWILGLLGIGYGALSASWDDDEPGSLLGVDEFKTNIQRILEGLRRSSKDAKLRESAPTLDKKNTK
mmetsp:Transcript_9775/g.14908  ORF Transcript_9775/g.14908 Transcript_9775/m.14908 type:complete len:222 (-) Transcript_9775:4828-5493(-)